MTMQSRWGRRVYWVLAALIIVAAAAIRIHTVNTTVVDGPYRADSAQYFNYAYNLRHHGVYSLDAASVVNPNVQPKPDAMRPPGYPLFLAPLVTSPASPALFHTISIWQALLGTLVVLLVLLVFRRRLLPPWLALLVAAMVAISPQQVVIATFNLSENLFTPLLVLIVLVIALALRGGRRFGWGMLAVGITVGLAALTRPVLEYFVPFLIVLLLVSYPRKQALKAGALVVVGFALMWGPWVARNLATLGKAGDDRLMIETLHQGMYPGLMYRGEPASLGIPYRFDPDYQRTDATLETALADISRHWRAQPGRELEWYLIGKPIQLWSWDLVAAGPHADIFIYRTWRSPYFSNRFYIFTEALMRTWHWPLVILALLGSIFVLLPVARRAYRHETLFILRVIAVLLLYNTVVLMVGAPFTRYSTPFLPLVFGMALVLLVTTLRWVRARTVTHRDMLAVRPD